MSVLQKSTVEVAPAQKTMQCMRDLGHSRSIWLSGVVAMLAGISSFFGAAAQSFKSPWDSPVILHTAGYTCPASPPFAETLTIDSYYIDKNASVADPAKLAAFQHASEPTTRLSQAVTKAADRYRETGSSEAAACVYSLLAAAAKAGAWSGKMPSFQGVYVQNWLLSAVAVAYLKVRQSEAGTPEQDVAIQGWLSSLAIRVHDYFDEEIARGGIEKENNHLYWAGLSLAAEGIADGDRKNFDWGLRAYRAGAHAIQPDGTLPQELWRGQMTMHYHLYALASLIMIAELGEANGFDLYAESGASLHRLVRICVAALADPKVFEQRTGIVQVVAQPYVGSDIGWAVPYLRRFPEAEGHAALAAIVAKSPSLRYTTWGGTPPD